MLANKQIHSEGNLNTSCFSEDVQYMNDGQKQQALTFTLIFPRGTRYNCTFKENHFFKKINKEESCQNVH